MQQEFIWDYRTLMSVTISDTDVIAKDKEGLLTGGWFLKLDELPADATVIATAKDVKDNCTREGDYCRIFLDV